MTTDFKCAGCGEQIAKDQYPDEYAWWKAVCEHWDSVHPLDRAKA